MEVFHKIYWSLANLTEDATGKTYAFVYAKLSRKIVNRKAKKKEERKKISKQANRNEEGKKTKK